MPSIPEQRLRSLRHRRCLCLSRPEGHDSVAESEVALHLLREEIVLAHLALEATAEKTGLKVGGALPRGGGVVPGKYAVGAAEMAVQGVLRLKTSVAACSALERTGPVSCCSSTSSEFLAAGLRVLSQVVPSHKELAAVLAAQSRVLGVPLQDVLVEGAAGGKAPATVAALWRRFSLFVSAAWVCAGTVGF